MNKSLGCIWEAKIGVVVAISYAYWVLAVAISYAYWVLAVAISYAYWVLAVV